MRFDRILIAIEIKIAQFIGQDFVSRFFLGFFVAAMSIIVP
jgi:hypothetical protein